MEYKGIEYSVVKLVNSIEWQWSAMLPNRKRLKVGNAVSREFAIRRAKVAIDEALKKSASQVKAGGKIDPDQFSKRPIP